MALLARQTINATIIGWLDSKIRAPRTSTTFTRECAWDPRVLGNSQNLSTRRLQEVAYLVSVIPKRDTDAVLHIIASPDRVDIILLLQLQPGNIVGQLRKTDIQLRLRNLHTQCGEGLHVRPLVRSCGRIPNDEVRLQPHTVDLDTSRLDGLNDLLGSGGLVARVLDVVIVVIQLDAAAGSLHRFFGKVEDDGDIVWTNSVEPEI